MNRIKPETIRILRHDTWETSVYRWPQCNHNKRFCKSHDRLSKITTGNRCQGRWTLQNLTNLNSRDPDILTMDSWKIGLFIGNADKSRDLSPWCFESRDRSDFENEKQTSRIQSLSILQYEKNAFCVCITLSDFFLIFYTIMLYRYIVILILNTLFYLLSVVFYYLLFLLTFIFSPSL